MVDIISSPRGASVSTSSSLSASASRPRTRHRHTSLFLLLVATLISTSFSSPHQSLRGGVAGNETILVQDHPVVYPAHFNHSLATQNHRHLSTGRRTVLIIRVIASDRSPTPTAATLKSHIFTHPHSLANQMNLCSARSLTLVPASYGNGGVVDVRINARSSDVRGMIAESQQVAPNFIPGVSNLYNAANHVMFVFPQTTNYVAEAEIGGRYSWYNNGLAESLSVIMHEIGHNFGLDHAGVPVDEYGDYSANMGRSVSSKLSPRMCFNAANNWQLGWYPNARRTLSSLNAPTRITVSAFVEYPSTRNPVLIKILSNTFLQFNGRASHNVGTRTNSNQVVIVRQEGNRLTTLLSGLSSGQIYRGSGFVVQVCSINGARSADISIGRSTTSCTGGVATTNSLPAPRPSPPTFSWTGSVPASGRTPVGNPWPATPRSPSPPWFSAPAWPSTPSPPSPFTFGFTPSPPSPFTFGFSPPSPSPPSPFTFGFSPTPPSPFRFAPSPPTFSSAAKSPWTKGWASIFFGGSSSQEEDSHSN